MTNLFTAWASVVSVILGTRVYYDHERMDELIDERDVARRLPRYVECMTMYKRELASGLTERPAGICAQTTAKFWESVRALEQMQPVNPFVRELHYNLKDEYDQTMEKFNKK